jgi:hypothetical protein
VCVTKNWPNKKGSLLQNNGAFGRRFFCRLHGTSLPRGLFIGVKVGTGFTFLVRKAPQNQRYLYKSTI